MDRNPDLRAPLFADCWDLSVRLINKTRPYPHDVLARSISEESIHLLDVVTLALKNIDREQSLWDADASLIRLRLRLRLAMETDLLDEQEMLYALEHTDAIGRQIGGWQKHL